MGVRVMGIVTIALNIIKLFHFSLVYQTHDPLLFVYDSLPPFLIPLSTFFSLILYTVTVFNYRKNLP